MSIPKEPRQQMINIMYLVLIALLALNVSAEILNAFKVVDKGINDATASIKDKNEKTLESFAEQIKKNTNGVPYYEVASSLKPITQDYLKHIDDLFTELVDASGTDPEKGDEQFQFLVKKDDQDTPTRVLVGEEGNGKGYVLVNKMKEVRKAYIDQVAVLLDNPALSKEERDAVQADIVALQNELPIKEVDATTKNEEGKDWVQFTFGQVPMLPVLTILDQYKNDAVAAESMIVDKMFGKIGAKLEFIDKFEAAVVPKTGTVIMQGDKFEADIFVAASASTSAPSISVNGSGLKVTEGKATYTASGNSLGKKTFKGVITTKDSFGKALSVPFEQSYEVVPRPDHVAVVSPTKMNVFYIGVENPVSASITGIKAAETKVNMSGGTIKKAGGPGSYTVTVNKPGTATVNLSGPKADGSGTFSGKAEFRVKRIPDPYPELGGKPGGGMKSGVFRAQKGMIAKLEDFVFDAKFNVVGFEMTLAERGEDLLICTNAGGTINGKCKELQGRAKPGSIYFFDKIKAKGPDGTVRNLGTISFKIL